MNALFHAIAFLTRLPVPVLSSSQKDWERSVAYYPLVGLLIGFLLWGVSWLSFYLAPPALAAVLLFAFWVFITGGLHIDGWMDLADGMGSNRDRQRTLEIMKDSRTGSMGVIAALFLFMLKGVSIFYLLESKAFLLFLLPPLAARFFLVAAIWFWPYISEKGMATGLKKGLAPWMIVLAFLGTGGIFYVVNDVAGLLVLAFSILMSWMFIRMVLQRLGGLTGDVYGALVEWTEMVILVLLVLAGRWSFL
jgi:adenosylcobinamide-GDP ribazoletransferase